MFQFFLCFLGIKFTCFHIVLKLQVSLYLLSSSLIHRITILLSTCLLWCEQYFRSTVFIDYCDHLIYICAFLRVAVFVPISRHNLSTVTQCLAIYHFILSYPCYAFISLSTPHWLVTILAYCLLSSLYSLSLVEKIINSSNTFKSFRAWIPDAILTFSS